MLSIIIPTLNAENTLSATLDSLEDHGINLDVVIVDGGSQDATRNIAAHKDIRVLVTPPGRGRQLAAGAAAAHEPWLLFLHADTRLSTDWPEAFHHFISDKNNLMCAGYFHLTFDDQSPASARVARLANWRAQTFGLPYGDQGLLIHSSLYNGLGGFQKDLDLMEDVDLVRRIGITRLRCLPADVITSSWRYRAQGWWWRSTKNLLCLALYFLGAPMSWIKRLYA